MYDELTLKEAHFYERTVSVL